MGIHPQRHVEGLIRLIDGAETWIEVDVPLPQGAVACGG